MLLGMIRRMTSSFEPFQHNCRFLAVTGRKSKNVAAKKNKMDAMKNKLYHRLGIKILMAAKAGGIDPSKNIDLHRVLKEAHTVKLPKDNIERVLRKASDACEAEDFKSGTYEVFGHGGVGMIVVSLTDSTNRANMTIKAMARKADVKMASQGSVIFQFLHKAKLEPSNPYEEEAVIEAALAADVDDVMFMPSSTEHASAGGDLQRQPAILVDPVYLGAMQDALTAQNIPSVGSLVYLPNESVRVTEEEYLANLDLIESFEDLEDVDAVYHNMAEL